MRPGRVMKELGKALGITPEKTVEIYSIEKYDMSPDRVEAILSGKEDATYEELGIFLDALIAYKRGDSPKKPSDDEDIVLDSNLILKKIRVALSLRDMDMTTIFELADVEMGRSMLRDIFRSPSHPKYRECPDSLLASFLEGLYEFLYDPQSDRQVF